MSSFYRRCALVGALTTAGSTTALGGIPGPCAMPPARSTFLFRSGFWLNLHNFLHRDAKARRGIHDEAPAALIVSSEDTLGGRALTSRERFVWDAAVQVYVSNPLASGRADSVVSLLNERLATAVEDGGLRDVGIDPAVRQALLNAEWLPHLQGRRSFAEAVAQLVARLPRQPV